MARLLVERGLGRVLVIEKRDHLGGNCHDYVDEHGIVVHRYGPHLFHTENQRVVELLSRFTEFEPYEHRVQASIEGRLVPLPFNLSSIEACFDPDSAGEIVAALVGEYGEGSQVPILELRQNPSSPLRRLADFVYDNVFLDYTSKQWGCRPEDVNPEVTARVRVRVSRDGRYFRDSFQQVPTRGYSRIFAGLLDHPDIDVELSTPASAVLGHDARTGGLRLFGNAFAGHLVYTGSIDELFDYRYGELSYRSLDLRLEYHDRNWLQPCAVVNHPSAPGFTRVTEFKHIHRMSNTATGSVTMTEYPRAYDRCDPARDVPFYPCFRRESMERYERYRSHAETFANITLLGRLAEYRYYDMDDAVARALDVFETRFQP
jgi:UDP-galactopyranose mutase